MGHGARCLEKSENGISERNTMAAKDRFQILAINMSVKIFQVYSENILNRWNQEVIENLENCSNFLRYAFLAPPFEVSDANELLWCCCSSQQSSSALPCCHGHKRGPNTTKDGTG